MIRILTHKEHINGTRIFDRYLYMAAWVLPFSPEDVLGDDHLEVDGKVVTADNFINISNKFPRIRNEKYKKKLIRYKISDVVKDKKQRFEQDQLLASRVVYNSNKKLYDFLYTNNPYNSRKPPNMKKVNLRKLLTVKMDELDSELKQIKNSQYTCYEDLMNIVFRYDVFAQSPHAIELLKDMNVSVCPYCNRQYTFSVAQNNRTSRAQFDHFYPKDQFPSFAISLYNLIPSCGLCNLAKSNNVDKILYPYSDEMGHDVRFETKYVSGFRYLFGDQNAKNEFDVSLQFAKEDLETEYKDKVTKSIEYFNLDLLYREHKDYILSLFRNNYVFNDDYLNMLCEQFPHILQSKKEVKSLLYLMDIEKEHWGERVLGKLTHDIDLEINSGALIDRLWKEIKG